MANKTGPSTLDLANDPPPMRVQIFGIDASNVLRAIGVNSGGALQGGGGAGGGPTADGTPSTGTVTSVNDTNASTTLLAANTARYGACVYNDSTVNLYLLLGAGTASSSNFTALLLPGSYYEAPFGFTGQITGIWASDASGAARVTELT